MRGILIALRDFLLIHGMPRLLDDPAMIALPAAEAHLHRLPACIVAMLGRASGPCVAAGARGSLLTLTNRLHTILIIDDDKSGGGH